MNTIIANSLETAYTYDGYRRKIKNLLEETKPDGNAVVDPLIHYTILNETRMDRLEKTVKISDEAAKSLRSLKENYRWLVISEGWCGDAAQLVPIFRKLEDVSDKIEMRIVFRDENLELMDLFLSNGSRSIPKLIVIDENYNVRGHWGPRPKDAADLISRHKAAKGEIDEEAKTELQLWYLHDKGISTQEEIVQMMEIIDGD